MESSTSVKGHIVKPKALILQAHGTNRDDDVAEALTLAGAEIECVPLNHLRANRKRFADYQMLALPGGFSYADSLGAGKLLAIDLNTYFIEEINMFVQSGKAVIGICNGFQALIKSGVLPFGTATTESGVTLTYNAHGHFECRWVTLKAVSQNCIWTRDLNELIECPVAHGEGNFQTSSDFQLSAFVENHQVALAYVCPNGSPAAGEYPFNPNGSIHDIAGICNPQGNVLGLMPHPENHIHPFQHPHWTRGISHNDGLALFKNGVRYTKNISS